MGTYQWAFTLVTVALLLDHTFGDIMVQPGYQQPEQATKSTVVQAQTTKNQPAGSPHRSDSTQQHPLLQMLQQEHAVQQRYLKDRHAQEQSYLMQQQQQQFQLASAYAQQVPEKDVVGVPWRDPTVGTYLPGLYGGTGAYSGGRLFSMGPLGLQALRIGNLGGLGGGGLPLLLSPHQANPIVDNAQFRTTVAGPTQPRTKREIGARGELPSSTSKQRGRPQSHRMATDQTLRSKPDANLQNTQPSKTKEEIVGDAEKQDNENVGSSLLDPLGMIDKTENIIKDLKSGHFPNPLEMFTNGRHHKRLNEDSLGKPSLEEHFVGQSQQYPARDGSNTEYMMNRPQYPYQHQQSRVEAPHPMYNFPSPRMGPSSSPYIYGAYPSSHQPYGSSRMRQPNSMAHQGNPMIGGSDPAQTINTHKYRGGPMIGAQNPAVQNLGAKFSMSNPNTKVTEVRDSTVGNAQVAREKASDSRQSSLGDSMTADPIIRAPNPSLGSSAAYDQTVGSPMQMNNLYELARAAQPLIGTLFNPMTGSSSPAAWNTGGVPYRGAPGQMGERNSMVGNPLINGFYDPNRQMSYYNPQNYRHFDFADIFDEPGYNYNHHHNHNHMHHGSIDRIYGTYVDDPYGYGPHYSHNNGYIY